MAEPQALYDLLFLVDATGSMGGFLNSLQASLPKIISISALTGAFDRIGLLAYRDYDSRGDLLQWSGWRESTDSVENPAIDLVAMAKGLRATGGGDYPEAVKTGLAKAYEVTRDEATTVIVLYADAPPHTMWSDSNHHYQKEQQHLKEAKVYGGHGTRFTDWFCACRTIAGRKDSKRAQVFPILNMWRAKDVADFAVLATITNGTTFRLHNDAATEISKLTVEFLLTWMGAGKAGTEAEKYRSRLIVHSQESEALIKKIQKEKRESQHQLPVTKEVNIDSNALKEHLTRRKPLVQDFGTRYKQDPEYRNLVVQHLKKIIETDVTAVSLNPVFGSLWRTVCNDRDNEHRDGLISRFGLQVERISDQTEKTAMKKWLEESYDYTAEVEETIAKVADARQYPCVFLDPTLAFTRSDATTDKAPATEDVAITSFSRDELLEIGRSCDYKILRRLGRVLTRLTYVQSADDLPDHITKAEKGQVVRLPLTLASDEHQHKFWKMLLHLVVPGTLLAARPAALLAALSIRIGVAPLIDIAEAEMLRWRSKWNTMDFPETWNTSCLSLLLDADRAYRNRKEIGLDQDALLKGADRDLFDRLVSYKTLEMNMATTLHAQVGWKPEKSTMPIGPVVVCRDCQYPRSVTIMGINGKCGICLYDGPDQGAALDVRVSKDDTAITSATWVECAIQTCRAQYIVYDVERLNVRAKCHYCRMQSTTTGSQERVLAPCLECHKCLNRVIYPESYRPASLDPSRFECTACTSSDRSIITTETTARHLGSQNGFEWLLLNLDGKLQNPLSSRTLYHQVSTLKDGLSDFTSKVILFPERNASLTLDGKTLHNADEVVAELQSWVSRRRAEAGTCSLCFNHSRKMDLHPACGRRGCEQRVCQSCLGGWYGLNAAGRTINVAALTCPFCRRAPTAKTLNSYGMGIHAVAGLQDAVRESGNWIYAWCEGCATAKPYMERVCAAGAPAELGRWNCEDCQLERERERERERARARERAREPARIYHDEDLNGSEDEVLDGENEVYRECPSCTTMVQKTYGCGHIACHCGAHWCWFCGKLAADEDDIYDHMQQEHGGFFA